MKRISIRIAAAVLCLWILPAHVLADRELTPVGQVIGLELLDGRVTVAAFDDALGRQTQKAGLAVGDVIVQIDNMEISSSDDIRRALVCSGGTVTVKVLRGDRYHTFKVEPQITSEGPRLGIYLRQGVTGIGTVTWYDPETGEFGTLGHGVSNSKGQLLDMTEGYAYHARILTVKKGVCGDPGQLMGSVASPVPVGELERNTEQGVFGISKKGWQGDCVPVAKASEVKTGKAVILATVSGSEVREYSVEILKIYPAAKTGGRNMVIKVTDPGLLEATGGIVQGMSGSPILQNGKLIGAVTHVLVNDPTTGYGIFIENMLDAAA